MFSHGNMPFITVLRANFPGRFSTNPALNPDNHDSDNNPGKEET